MTAWRGPHPKHATLNLRESGGSTSIDQQNEVEEGLETGSYTGMTLFINFQVNRNCYEQTTYPAVGGVTVNVAVLASTLWKPEGVTSGRGLMALSFNSAK
jgi:hypothetical protein